MIRILLCDYDLISAENINNCTNLILLQDNVCVETAEGLKNCRLIAVHGGLQQGKPVDEQLKLLRARDTAISKVECLSGRKTIWDMPEVSF